MKDFEPASPFSIGRATIDPRSGEIEIDGEISRAEPRQVAVLQLLARRPGEVVTRQELLDTVWQGGTSGDESLTQVVSRLRNLLGDSARTPLYIETIPKIGYRLIGDPAGGSRHPHRIAGPSGRPDSRWMHRLSRGQLLVLAVIAALLGALALRAMLAEPDVDMDLQIEDIDLSE